MCVLTLYPTQAAEVCGSLEIDSAIDTVRALANEMAEAKREAQQGKLLPLPGETVENCALELGATSKTVGSSMAQLLTAANQGVGCVGVSDLSKHGIDINCSSYRQSKIVAKRPFIWGERLFVLVKL